MLIYGSLTRNLSNYYSLSRISSARLSFIMGLIQDIKLIQISFCWTETCVSSIMS